MIASIWEKGISILAGNLNSDRSYLITAVTGLFPDEILKKMSLWASVLKQRWNYCVVFGSDSSRELWVECKQLMAILEK